jgi:hypothetical protein
VASSLAGEMSVALPVVGEKGGGGGFYRRLKTAGGGELGMAQKWSSVAVREGASPGLVAEALPAVVAPECGGSYVVLQLGDGGGG